MITGIVVGVLILAILFYGVNIYNQLVDKKNFYKNAFSQINVQLKRRYDLIPNLVETAKSYMEHERGTLQEVTEARNAALAGLKAASENPGAREAMQSLVHAEQQLTSALGKLNVAIEAYPELKASQNMMQLSEELTSTENKIAFARQAYNDSVMEYNTYRQSFPNSVIAGAFGHQTDATLLEFVDQEVIEEAPKVSFN